LCRHLEGISPPIRCQPVIRPARVGPLSLAPGGQCFQLLPIAEDQSYYKGAGDGPNAAKQKEAEALKEKAMSELALSHNQMRAAGK